MLPNLALRKKWYYINLKGKTQGKGEKQGPSVENKPFLWVRIEKICPDTFWSMDASGRKWTLWTLLGPPWTLFSKVTIISQIVQELTQTMSSMFFVQKLTLVVVQNMSGHFLVHGRCGRC